MEVEEPDEEMDDVYEEQEEEEDETAPVTVTSDADFVRRVQEKLGAAVGAQNAAPIVTAFVEKWKCDDCSTILQSPAEFPLHMLSSMSSSIKNTGSRNSGKFYGERSKSSGTLEFSVVL